MDTVTVCVVATLPGSAREVFRALTDPDRHGEFTGAESRIDASPGGRFSYFDGGVSGVFEELEQDRRIVQELRAATWPEGHHARVTQELIPTEAAHRTHVEVVEEGVPADVLGEVIDGWKAYWEALARHLREQRLELVRRFVEEYKNRQNPAAVDDFVADDCVVHIPLPGLPTGREGMRVNGELMCSAFPDVHAEREFLLTDGDLVVERAVVQATHGGELMGIEPTGNPVGWTELHAYRVVDGRITEVWSEADFMGVMVRIGAVSLPGM